jgi:hypothetical protein
MVCVLCTLQCVLRFDVGFVFLFWSHALVSASLHFGFCFVLGLYNLAHQVQLPLLPSGWQPNPQFAYLISATTPCEQLFSNKVTAENPLCL